MLQLVKFIMVVTMMAEIPGLQYYLFALLVLLLGSIFYNLKQKFALKKRDASETALVKEAYFNPITELPNKKNLDIIVEEQIHRVHRRAQSFLIAVIRIKNYNEVNLRSKTLGDEFMTEAGSKLVDVVRDEDLVAHISESNFVLLFNEHLEEENYDIIFDRVKLIFKDKYQVDEKKTLEYKIGIGKSVYPNDGTDSETLIIEATNKALR